MAESKPRAPWYVEVLRREGLITVLVLLWFFRVYVPDSDHARATYDALRESIAGIEQCERSQAEAAGAERQFQSEAAQQHRDLLAAQRQLLEHASQTADRLTRLMAPANQ